MVKGVSRQVIVVHSHDRKLFEQAIFILSDEAIQNGAISDEALMKEARRLIASPAMRGKTIRKFLPVLYASAGAVLTGAIWLIAAIL